MLATFIGQMICHHTGFDPVRLLGEAMFVQFNEEHGWTDRDLLQWFSLYSSASFTKSASLVIDGFDECPRASRDSFVEWLYRRMSSEETPWKVAITSRRLISLPQGLQGSRKIDMTSNERLDMGMQAVNATELKSLLSRYRPELLNDYAWTQSTQQISNGDSIIENIMHMQSIPIPEWPHELTTRELFNLVGDDVSGDELLMRILDCVFQKLSDQFQIKTMLTWLLHSARPLFLWEFTSVMYPEYLDNLHASPAPDKVREFAQFCETRLRGIIEIRDATVRLRHPRLRELLTRPQSAGSPAYLWNDIDPGRAAYDITKVCLEFLTRPNVQQELESMIEQATLENYTYESASRYTNFCSYAAYYWPRHAALVPDAMELSALLEEPKRTALNSTWLTVYWYLENPVTRTKQPPESVDSLLASLCLPYSDTGTWDSRSIEFATQKAAARGQFDIVKMLLPRCEQTESTLVDALVASASSGQEQLVLHIFRYIMKTKKAASETVKWPPCLIYRAAWLGMDKFAMELLEAGCSPEPGGPMALKPRTSPLHQATRHGHINTMEVLISQNADLRFQAYWGRSLLFTAAGSRRPDVFKTLFEKGKVDVTAEDEFNSTPLNFAAQWGLKAAVKALLEIGADPNDNKNLASSDIGWLPLVHCSALGRTESARILLDGGADPNQPGPHGKSTALWYAATNNFPQTVRLLLEKGADPNHPL